jgi:tetratricopeptide (TPR) repeat protein
LDGGNNGLIGPERARWQALLGVEEQNARAALAHLARRGDAEAGLRLWWTIWRFWLDRGQWDEARDWLDRFLAFEHSAEWRARGLFAGGMIGVRQRDPDAARNYLRACLALSLEQDLWRCQAAALTQLGHLAFQANDLHAAAAHHREALALRRAQGNDREVAVSLSGLANVTADLGDMAAAEALLVEALTLLRAWGDKSEEGALLNELANIASRRGNPAAAQAYLVASLECGWQLDAPARLMTSLTILAVQCADAAPEEVLRLLGGLRALAEHWRLPPDPISEADTAAVIAALRARLGLAVADAAWADGATADRATINALATAVIARQAEAHGSPPAPEI